MEKSTKQPFTVFTVSTIGLNFLERIRVLFGKEIVLSLDVELDNEVIVLNTTSSTKVRPFFKPRPRNAGAMIDRPTEAKSNE